MTMAYRLRRLCSCEMATSLTRNTSLVQFTPLLWTGELHRRWTGSS